MYEYNSSEDEFDNYLEVNQRRSIATRKIIRDFQNPFEYYNDDEFKRRYRFTKDAVMSVLLPLINEDLIKITRRGLPIPPIYQLLVALRFYTSAKFQVTGDLIKISQPSVSRIVRTISHLLSLKVQEHIKFPRNLEMVKEQFYSIAHFPGIIGTVDGTHIPIQNPGGPHSEVYRNRKRYFSINTQIVSGPDLLIYNIVASRPGSVHDNRIFESCTLKEI